MAPGLPIRILVVDDSAVMRSLLRSVIASDRRLEVVGTAADGASALAALELHRPNGPLPDPTCPDIVLLDVEMPVMDGLVTLRQLRQRGHRMPVIMCSSLTHRGARVTIEALASGASDYVTKPAGQDSREQAIRTLAQDLLPKIHALAGRAQTRRAAQSPAPSASPLAARPIIPLPISPPASQNITAVPTAVVIGVSTGGPAALDLLLPALPAGFPLPVLIVQHMPEVFTRLFAERLNDRCCLRVSEAVEGAPVQPGAITVARGNWHLEVIAPARPGAPATLHLNQDPTENHCRPAVDVLFRSAARVYGSGALAIILTGMGCDGLAGCRVIRSQGGSVLAQDQASSTVWGMPGAVTQAGLAHKVLPLASIAPEIVRLAGRTAASELAARKVV
jgi:two-component system, chemotaxis family, protein-glutamate methylesterase/glutaminase